MLVAVDRGRRWRGGLVVAVDGGDDREKELAAGSDGGGEGRFVLVSCRSQRLLASVYACCP